ncbi:hypothetical protein [Pseudoalteromonas aurantia]|uniref:Uncharacterized protein n=1 Tax=Pseudoalteromonas aurantia TaxID=43654 RepID=A0ABY2VYQ2_9GAMM|nr:hypothetical protein [Pseudoalteromonas aurantia]TMO75328.1 hypothetical protein CWC20_08380 [Pseudoalteromonas aurantia]
MFPLPQNFTNTGTMPISGGAANSGSGDTTYHNNTRFGGMNYNKGIPTWAIVAGLSIAVLWVITSAKG